MAKYICSVCEYVHDEEKTGQQWEDLPDDWVCPICDSPKSYFPKPDADESAPEPKVDRKDQPADTPALIDLQKTMAEAEPYFCGYSRNRPQQPDRG